METPEKWVKNMDINPYSYNAAISEKIKSQEKNLLKYSALVFQEIEFPFIKQYL